MRPIYANSYRPPDSETMDRCACGRTKRKTDALCHSCEVEAGEKARRAAQGADLLANETETMRTILELAGMSPEHMDARLDLIPAGIASAVPQEARETLEAGKTPPSGFGLAGTTGAGKSMAVAALVSAYMRARVREHAPTMGNRILSARPPIRWEDWPLAVAWMRDNVDKAGARVERLQDVPLLVLDDLGAERRVKASYEEEFGAEKLDLILHGRRLRKLPTIWTANLGSEALRERYGARAFSRLVGSNPCIAWINSPDLRMARPRQD